MTSTSLSNGGDATGATTTKHPSPEKMTVFRPPIVRSSVNALNRALFTKKINLAAAAINDSRTISKYRKTLTGTRDILTVERISPIVPHPDTALRQQGKKCILLEPHVKAECKWCMFLVTHTMLILMIAPETWGPTIQEGVQSEELSVMPYELELGYDYWSFREFLTLAICCRLY